MLALDVVQGLQPLLIHGPIAELSPYLPIIAGADACSTAIPGQLSRHAPLLLSLPAIVAVHDV